MRSRRTHPATQGDRTQQQRIYELTLQALKEIFPSLPTETKDLVSIKKALQGDGDWTTTKEILGWMLDTEDGTLRLSPQAQGGARNPPRHSSLATSDLHEKSRALIR